jgi:hypothetical protein
MSRESPATVSQKPSSPILAREEIRGLFTLGLLAVVASIRIQNPNGISLTINGIPYNLTTLIDWMIFM